jgi:hypothetical protein
VVVDQLWVVGISGGSVEFGNLIADREAVGHFGSPSGRAEPMASGPKMGTVTLVSIGDLERSLG